MDAIAITDPTCEKIALMLLATSGKSGACGNGNEAGHQSVFNEVLRLRECTRLVNQVEGRAALASHDPGS